jgi:oligopeptide/dipeptide ABC transporter ATP-binding protein
MLGRSAGAVKAVDGVSFSLAPGEVLGVVGESGSGKTTLGRAIVGMAPVTAGSLRFEGRNLPSLRGSARRAARRRVQMVFQDPHGSLDPRLTAQRSVAEPLTALLGLDKVEAAGRAAELLERVGLPPEAANRRPHELSGGQRQRVAVARAIAVHPKLVVADEPTSALDVSVQGQVMNLLLDLRRDLGLAYLLISHNLSLVLAVADRVGVMYLGALVELAPAAELLARPAHPYSARLLAANPDLDAGRFQTDPVDAADPPPDPRLTDGCRYRARCPRRRPRCDQETPALRELSAGHFGACHFPATEDLPLLGAPA